MTVHYVDLSEDAAIAGTYKDFKFVNSTEYPIYIEGYTTSDKKITFNIYGKETRDKNRTISFESQIVSETPATTILQEDAGQGIGYKAVSKMCIRDRKWVREPYNVDGWRLDVAADLGFTEEYNHKFWKEFRAAVKAERPDALILAEHYGDTSRWLGGDEWDTVCLLYTSVGRRYKDRIQIENFHAQILQVIKLIPDSLKITAIEAPYIHRFRKSFPVLHLMSRFIR